MNQSETPVPCRLAVTSSQGLVEGTMATRTPPTPPAWTAAYQQFAAWTQDEFRNILCGLPPVAPADAPARTPQKIADDYVRDEVRRVAADRHIQDAILAGELKVLDPPDEQLVEKIKPHLAPAEFEAIKRAITHDRVCSKAYRVATDVAIRWASSRRDLFPDFPFTPGHVQFVSNVPSNGVVLPDVKEHRQVLVRRALKTLRLTTRAAFCRKHPEITSDILRAVVNGDSRRADVALWTPKVLALLGIADREWNAA
jgi:hypothetical protein